MFKCDRIAIAGNHEHRLSDSCQEPEVQLRFRGGREPQVCEFFIDRPWLGNIGCAQFLQILWSQTLGSNVHTADDEASDQLRMPDREHQRQYTAVAESHNINMLEF